MSTAPAVALFAIVGVASTASAAVKAVPSATLDSPSGARGDVARLALETDGTRLVVTVTTRDDLAARGKATGKATEVVEVLIDTDGNPATGGKAFSMTPRTGFETKLEIVACVKARPPGIVKLCAGGLDPKTVEGVYGSVGIQRLATGKTLGDRVVSLLADEAERMVTLSPKTLKASIPYAKIGLTKGRDVRILVRQGDDPSDEKAFFPEVALAVK